MNNKNVCFLILFLTICNIFRIFAFRKTHIDMNKLFKVIHLELKADHSHHYFGSLKALCANYGKEDLGVVYSYLRTVDLGRKKFYENNKCVIRQGELITSPRNGSKDND